MKKDSRPEGTAVRVKGGCGLTNSASTWSLLLGGSRSAGAAAFSQTSPLTPRADRLGFTVTCLVVGHRVLGDFRRRVATAIDGQYQPQQHRALQHSSHVVVSSLKSKGCHT